MPIERRKATELIGGGWVASPTPRVGGIPTPEMPGGRLVVGPWDS